MSSVKIVETNREADLVIIGGGGAGLSAAVAAAEGGVNNIIVLEKLGATGGNTAMATGFFAAESQAQKRAAIDARCEDLFKIAMNWAHWRTNPRIVRAYINKSGDTVRWLEDKGLFFDCVARYPNQVPIVWHQASGGGAEVMKVLASECKKLCVTVFTRTRVNKIQVGDKGNVIGVLANMKGEEIAVTAKSVIIASGGYGDNTVLLKKYSPDYHDNMVSISKQHTGDGLVMAMEIGAATEGLGLLLMSGPTPGSVSMNFGTLRDKKTVGLMAIALEPNTIWVNRFGERFADEALGYNHFMSTNAVIRQPGNICFVLFDQEIVRIMEKEGIFLGMGRYRVDQRTKIPGLEQELRALVDKGYVKIEDSWEGLAKWIGTSPEVLKATIDEYNADCARGYDTIFAKDRRYLMPLYSSPYYAIKCSSNILDTLGGIKINEHMQVLDKQDNPIQGLYAAGVVAGGWQAETYNVVTTGAAFGFAINSGRIAGEEASRFIDK